MPLLARDASGRSRPARARPRPTVSALVNNLDLTATILDLANASPCTAAGDCRTLDGRSLRAAAARPQARLGQGPRAALPDRLRTAPAASFRERGLRNFYDGVRTKRYVYIEHNRVNPETGDCDRPEYEMYDLKKDPYELHSIAVNPSTQTPSAAQASLAARLDKLRDCSGIAGRDQSAGPALLRLGLAHEGHLEAGQPHVQIRAASLQHLHVHD